jgi:hypothetical protein
MERAPQITAQALRDNLDHVYVIFGSRMVQNTADVNAAIYGSSIVRISRVAFERCMGHPESTVAFFRGWDGVEEMVCPVLSLFDFEMACIAAKNAH